MYKMNNSLQHYAWGSKTALTELYDIPNPQGLPQAELWMGAHPKSSSMLTVAGQPLSLREFIARDPLNTLGAAVAHRFGELPFLFKILCAAKALSVQVHPGKAAAVAGFARENASGLASDAAQRSFRDANHKPELVYALTPFQAMNGFRPLPEIAALLTPVAAAHHAIPDFIARPAPDTLAHLFTTLLTLSGAEQAQALDIVTSAARRQPGEVWQTLQQLAIDFPVDNGIFAPLLLNLITLQPGEAMFLGAETPHAYLQGTALEVMANSDNVLRAGLTPKFIDMPALLANITFSSSAADTLRLQPCTEAESLRFPVPVDDFAFAIHSLSTVPQRLKQSGAAVLFCVSGTAQLTRGEQTLLLRPGESCFVAASESPVTACGSGSLARVFTDLMADG